MSIQLLAWLVSAVGALAFVALGFVVGRRRGLAAEGPVGGAGGGVNEPAPGAATGAVGRTSAGPATMAAADPDATRVTGVPALPEARPVSPGGGTRSPGGEARAGRSATQPRWPTSREEELSQLLRELASTPGDVAVLADEGGLALAACGTADHEGLAALAGTVAPLFARISDLQAGGQVVRAELKLGDGRVLQLRPLGAEEDSPMVVVVGRGSPDDAQFAAVRGRIVRLVAGGSAAGG